MSNAPIPFRVTRYRCPHCPRTGSSKARITEHIGRCWTNPEARGCKTCKHYDLNYHGEETCAVGVDLGGQPACTTCGGGGEVFDLGDLGSTECPNYGGCAEIKRGPRVHCDLWEAAPPAGEPS